MSGLLRPHRAEIERAAFDGLTTRQQIEAGQRHAGRSYILLSHRNRSGEVVSLVRNRPREWSAGKDEITDHEIFDGGGVGEPDSRTGGENRVVEYHRSLHDLARVVHHHDGGRYRLLWAKNAHEACAVIREHATSLHAILMDVQLANSELDGIELTKLLRHKELTSPAPDYAAGLPLVPCPIFFVTAYGHLLAGPLVGEAGANGLVAKPVDFVKLSNLLARSHAMQALAALSV